MIFHHTREIIKMEYCFKKINIHSSKGGLKMKTAKTIKRIAKSVLPVSLCAVLLLGCVITVNAAARKMGNITATAKINNYGDIVLVPGILNIHAGFNNLIDPERSYAGHLFICQVTEAVVPITPDPNDPTKTEERRQLSEPYPSVINTQDAFIIRNDGVVAEASVQVLSNGVLGDLTVGENIEI